ncbi:ATP-binding protein [Nocardioides sp.]|jgi:signal transduction histidine kinase/CheY-like chemotaxis protein|uniref:hybrid sensor histidine kinase/response regulator n=1 Tax=Nocardioides sp. TaxID=35761 RepID=UPI002F42C710
MRLPTRSRSAVASATDGAPTDPQLPALTRWLRPAVDAVARARLSIHQKLLLGFLTGALLLVGMATLSLVVIGQMHQRVSVLETQANRVDLAQQMLYDVTAQSHYRAMALLEYQDEASWNQKVADRKDHFAGLLADLEKEDPQNDGFFESLNKANQEYKAASDKVDQAFAERKPLPVIEKLHLKNEHPASHVVEDLLSDCGKPATASAVARPACHSLGPLDVPYIELAQQGMHKASSDFDSARQLHRNIVLAFSTVSVLLALLLGFLLSWSFLLPVKKMQRALAEMTVGNFRQRVEVPNRDEFGTLSQDLNSTSRRLESSFERQRVLSHRLRETNASLARASDAKSRFLASVSHELRTPMNAILGFTDALLAGVDGPLNDAQKESLGWVQRGGRDLLGLINQILDLSKIEAGKLTLDPQPFDPRELVASVVEQHRPLADQTGITLDWQDMGGPEEVILDGQRVRQILVNIVGNALKFTPGGRVDLEIDSREDGFCVAVRDTGPGVDVAQHEAIFEEFRQAQDDITGTGLGLAISRRLARAMKGDVTVESESGRGSIFSLHLPLDCRTSTSTPGNLEQDAIASDDQRLLLSVDDDPSVAPLLQKMLADVGYRVVAAQAPRTAAAEAKDLRPEAILLDLLMEERAGEEILRELKADPATSEIPVVIISVVDAEDVPELADGHLPKPVDKAALLDALTDLNLSGVKP